MRTIAFAIVILFLKGASSMGSPDEDVQAGGPEISDLLTDNFRWTTGAAILEAVPSEEGDWLSVKDPSVVRYGGRWHLFCTVRGRKRSHAIQYLSFTDWDEVGKAKRTTLSCHSGYFCAPQVFYFTPHKRWYLVCQAADDSWDPPYQPCWSSTDDISKPDSWSKLVPLFDGKPSNVTQWLDFWVICDESKAYLFFTSLDGKMWRSEMPLADFPKGWSRPDVVLRADVFEASHTYRLKGSGEYLTLIEAQHGHGWRYYKAYLAERLDGDWRPLAAERDKAFASMLNVDQSVAHWTDSVSHGELIRAGYYEKLELDPRSLRFVIQGVLDKDCKGKDYGDIPWRIGLLEPVEEPPQGGSQVNAPDR